MDVTETDPLAHLGDEADAVLGAALESTSMHWPEISASVRLGNGWLRAATLAAIYRVANRHLPDLDRSATEREVMERDTNARLLRQRIQPELAVFYAALAAGHVPPPVPFP